MADDAVLYEVADHIATITFNRPETQNTISSPMLNRFTELLLEADKDRERSAGGRREAPPEEHLMFTALRAGTVKSC